MPATHKTIHGLERPASEKRQGTKSRGSRAPRGVPRTLWGFNVGERSVGEVEPRPPARRVGSKLGVGTGVNERMAGCCAGFGCDHEPKFVGGHKRDRCRARAGPKWAASVQPLDRRRGHHEVSILIAAGTGVGRYFG